MSTLNLTAARLVWVTSNEVSGSSLSMSVLAALQVLCHSFACGADRILQHVTKDNTENCVFFLSFFVVEKIVLNQLLPLALSRLTRGHLLENLNKPARNLPVPENG